MSIQSFLTDAVSRADSTFVPGENPDLNNVTKPLLDFLDAALWPLVAIVAAVGVIYCVVLGVKIAKMDEQGSREKAKKDLLNAIIGFVLIFVLIISLKLAMPMFRDWAGIQQTTSGAYALGMGGLKLGL